MVSVRKVKRLLEKEIITDFIESQLYNKNEVGLEEADTYNCLFVRDYGDEVNVVNKDFTLSLDSYGFINNYSTEEYLEHDVYFNDLYDSIEKIYSYDNVCFLE